jgi:hypothetical protein
MLQEPPQHDASPQGGIDSGVDRPDAFTLTLGAEIRRTCSFELHCGQMTSSLTSRTLWKMSYVAPHPAH